MCFSATASFAGAAVIGLLGGLLCYGNISYFQFLSYKYSHLNAPEFILIKLRSDVKHWWPTVLTPLLFAAQQCSEGFVWMSINRGGNSHISGYIFCFFAFCLWPTWVPLACIVLESRIFRRPVKPTPASLLRLAWLLLTLILGLLVSIYTMVSLFSSDLTFSSENSHVVYHFKLIDIGGSSLVLLIPYLFCTLAPFCMVQSAPYMWIMSLCVGFAAIASFLLYEDGAFASTWCFFAAWLSAAIGFIRKRDAEITYKQAGEATQQAGEEEHDNFAEL